VEFAELEQLVKTRRSVRKWQNKRVPEDLIKKAIELATWAPNGGNQQNWRFYVILDSDKIKAIADGVRASSQLMASWTVSSGGPATPAPGFGRGPTFFEAAPALVAVAMSPYRSGADVAFEAREKTDPAAARMARARRVADSGVQSVSAAIAYLLLVFHQMGLGAVWMTGPIQAKDEIEKVLNVPSGLDVIALIPVGYPDETPQSRGRKPFSEVGEIVR
jgi:nitroreductase